METCKRRGVDCVGGGTASDVGELKARESRSCRTVGVARIRERENRCILLIEECIDPTAPAEVVRPATTADLVIASAPDDQVRSGIADEDVTEGGASDVVDADDRFIECRLLPLKVDGDTRPEGREIERVRPAAADQPFDSCRGDAVGSVGDGQGFVGSDGEREIGGDGAEVENVQTGSRRVISRFGDRVGPPVVGEAIGVVTESARKGVVACPRIEELVELVARDRITQGRADHLVDVQDVEVARRSAFVKVDRDRRCESRVVEGVGFGRAVQRLDPGEGGNRRTVGIISQRARIVASRRPGDCKVRRLDFVVAVATGNRVD